jgi:hypothetical protein
LVFLIVLWGDGMVKKRSQKITDVKVTRTEEFPKCKCTWIGHFTFWDIFPSLHNILRCEAGFYKQYSKSTLPFGGLLHIHQSQIWFKLSLISFAPRFYPKRGAWKKVS